MVHGAGELVSMGSLSSCSKLSNCLKAEAFCKMQPLLEVTPQTPPDSHHHSLEAVEQFLEQMPDKILSTPIPPRTTFESHGFFLV